VGEFFGCAGEGEADFTHSSDLMVALHALFLEGTLI
jgi:hypothetical protein